MILRPRSLLPIFRSSFHLRLLQSGGDLDEIIQLVYNGSRTQTRSLPVTSVASRFQMSNNDDRFGQPPSRLRTSTYVSISNTLINPRYTTLPTCHIEWAGELDLLSGPYHRLAVRANDREALEREGCSTVFRDGTQPRHLDQQSKSCGQL